jgi:hypothetical protein
MFLLSTVTIAHLFIPTSKAVSSTPVEDVESGGRALFDDARLRLVAAIGSDWSALFFNRMSDV